MAYPITNNSCSPFTEPDVPCTMGYYVAYTINATDASAVQEALRFAREHNTRLVNRNSGHDYLGKSTGAYDLEVWVHHMKSISLIKNYSNFGYSGSHGTVANAGGSGKRRRTISAQKVVEPGTFILSGPANHLHLVLPLTPRSLSEHVVDNPRWFAEEGMR
ncbi:hypothetical protein MGN70_004419 [Eutypa lata]|nr:hypothetical protein MGN70_004419 [Eutypa lata]